MRNDDRFLRNVIIGIAIKNALNSSKRAAHCVSQYANRQNGLYKELIELFD